MTPEQQEILDDIADAALDAEALLVQTCSISQPGETETGPWGEKATAALYTDEPCLLTPLSGFEATNAAATNSSAMFKLKLRRGLTVPLKATVEVDGKRYNVIGDRTSPLGVFTVLWLGA